MHENRIAAAELTLDDTGVTPEATGPQAWAIYSHGAKYGQPVVFTRDEIEAAQNRRAVRSQTHVDEAV